MCRLRVGELPTAVQDPRTRTIEPDPVVPAGSNGQTVGNLAVAAVVEQQTRITDLSNKLRIASATLDMERQLVASGKDFPELMAARQLHVIDVRDTDANGNRSKAFGRDSQLHGSARSLVEPIPETGLCLPEIAILHLARGIGNFDLTPRIVGQRRTVADTFARGVDICRAAVVVPRQNVVRLHE